MTNVLPTPSLEMVEFYEKRTKDHIDRVRNNIYKIVSVFSELKQELLVRALHHDEDKYSEEKYIPYVWLTWYYKCKHEGTTYKSPEGIKKTVEKASVDHVKTNRHHIQAHKKTSDMTNVDIAEMIADYAAMSQELNNSLVEWVKNSTLLMNKFSEEQIVFIWKLVGLFEPTELIKKGEGSGN